MFPFLQKISRLSTKKTKAVFTCSPIRRQLSKESEPEDKSQNEASDGTTVYTVERPRFSVAERDAKWQKDREEVSSIVDDFTTHGLTREFKYPQFEALTIKKRLKDKRDKISVMENVKLREGLAKTVREDISLGMFHSALADQTVDFLIIGAGIMGTAIAYALKALCKESITVLVIDRDLNYTHAASSLSLGGIRQQFSNPINIKLAQSSVNFFRKARDHLSFIGNDPPDLEFHAQGYLILVEEERAEKFFDYHKIQTEHGCFVELLSPSSLANRYPWLNLDGVVVASLGLQDEGWINPYHLLRALKGKAEFLGAHFIKGEVFDFNPRRYKDAFMARDEAGNPAETCHHALARLSHNEIVHLDFTNCFLCTGGETGALSKRLGLGVSEGMRKVPYPVVPRKRYVYVIEAPNAPVLDFPILVDTSGVICRRDGLGGHYVVTKVPTPEEEPDPGNLDVDYNYFYKVIHPLLSSRVRGFDNVKVIGAWAGYCEENVWDNSPIVGCHPYYDNIWWCGGFSSHGMQMAPAVAESLANAFVRGIFDEKYVDISAFNWLRLFANEKIGEDLVF